MRRPRRAAAILPGVVLLSGLLALAAPADAEEARGHRHDATSRRSFHDVDHWVKVFDDPKRDVWQKPDEVVAALALRPGMTVADLGAGTGYFSRRLSRAVGDAGTVLAIEVEPNLVAHIRERAEKEETANVVPVLGSPDNPRIPAGSADVVLVVDTVHHLDDRPGYLRLLRRGLRSGGRVAVIDFKKEPSPVGPPVDHRLARDQVVEEFGLAGYRLVGEVGILPYQYFLVFAPES